MRWLEKTGSYKEGPRFYVAPEEDKGMDRRTGLVGLASLRLQVEYRLSVRSGLGGCRP